MKKFFKNKGLHCALLMSLLSLSGCQSNKAPYFTTSDVDLESFMGTWYVVGYTPILVDGKAHNATEHYYLKPNGRIQATYQYRQGSFDGSLKTFQPKASVYNKETNAEWRMQFVWPFKSVYLIVHYDEAAGETIIGHPSKKLAWIMLREPEYDESTYQRLFDRLIELGYESAKFKRLPQDWSNEQLRKEMMQQAAPIAIDKKEWRKATRAK